MAQIDQLQAQQHEQSMAHFTQTFDIPERETTNTCSSSTQTDFKVLPLAAPKPQTKRVKQESSVSKDDAHLMATIRGMRVDLAIKEKALQRLNRELDDCKKLIKKLQKEKSRN